MSINLIVGAEVSVGVSIFMFFAGIIGLAIFFVPTIVAFKRSHRNRWVILLMNFLEQQ